MVFRLIKPSSTGWLDVSDLLENGWAGRLLVKRRASGEVRVRVHELDASAATSGHAFMLPPMFAPSAVLASVVRPVLHTTTPEFRRAYFAVSTLVVSGYQSTDVLYGEISFDTAAAMPPEVEWPGVSV